MAKARSAPEGAVRIRHPEARSCSYAGRVFTADRDGTIAVPAEAAVELAAHGFVPASTETAE